MLTAKSIVNYARLSKSFFIKSAGPGVTWALFPGASRGLRKKYLTEITFRSIR